MSSYGVGMIQFGGLASGLDTKSIVSALVALEKRPITLIENRKSRANLQKNAFTDLESKLGDLKKSLDALRKAKEFLEFTATPSEEGYFTASASNGAVRGNWEVSVEQLALAQRNKSAKYADKDTTTFGSGNLKITIGETVHEIGVGEGNNTLQGIAEAINSYRDAEGKGLGISATVLDTGTSPARYQLVLSAREGGTENAFSLSVDDGDAALEALVAEIETGDGGVTSGRFQAARNSLIRINGIQIERASNTIDDAIEGVTLTLLKPHTAPATEATGLAVATNASEIGSKIQKFVDAYNGVIDFIQNQTKVGESGAAEGVLVGDFTLRSIRSELRTIAGGPGGLAGPFSLFAFVGIEADRAGRLSFTLSEFEEALAEDEQAVEELFTNTETGLANRLYDSVDGFTDSVDGWIKNRKDGLDRTMKDLTRQIDAQTARLDRFETNLVKKFASYESLISSYQSQGSALGSIFSNS